MHIAVDVGGTFTDLLLHDAATNAILEGNGVRTAKWLTEKVTTPLAYDVDDFLNTPSGPVPIYDSQFDITRLETITNFLDRWMAAHKCLI